MSGQKLHYMCEYDDFNKLDEQQTPIDSNQTLIKIYFDYETIVDWSWSNVLSPYNLCWGLDIANNSVNNSILDTLKSLNYKLMFGDSFAIKSVCSMDCT